MCNVCRRELVNIIVKNAIMIYHPVINSEVDHDVKLIIS